MSRRLQARYTLVPGWPVKTQTKSPRIDQRTLSANDRDSSHPTTPTTPRTRRERARTSRDKTTMQTTAVCRPDRVPTNTSPLGPQENRQQPAAIFCVRNYGAPPPPPSIAHQVQRLLRVLVERCPRNAREEMEAFGRRQERDEVDDNRRHDSHHRLRNEKRGVIK